jgi:hypothetical protein
VNDAIWAAQQAHHPATPRLPVAFAYPRGGILGRAAIGLALLALGAAMLLEAGILWIFGGAIVAVIGAVAAVSNLSALVDRDRRKIVLDEHGVEIHYGFSRRHYPFLDYSDYRITRLGVRRFLTALPVEVERRLGQQAEQVRVTLHDRPAFLTPMPMLGDGAPAAYLLCLRSRLRRNGQRRRAAPPSGTHASRPGRGRHAYRAPAIRAGALP